MGYEIEHKFMGLVESNPEEGWIRDEFLLRSGKICASKSVDTSSYDKLKTKKAESAYHSFLSASVDNKYLPKTFIPDMCVGKSDKWVRKYIYCYLEVKEGTVYPEFMDCIVDPFPVPRDWLRVYGFDKGWADATCLCCGAIDPNSGICYIYDEYYESQQPITFHGRRVKEKIDGFEMYKPIQADPSVRNKNDRDGVSYQDYFYQTCGIWLAEGNNKPKLLIKADSDTTKMPFDEAELKLKEQVPFDMDKLQWIPYSSSGYYNDIKNIMRNNIPIILKENYDVPIIEDYK
jgi:hypothetical protein